MKMSRKSSGLTNSQKSLIFLFVVIAFISVVIGYFVITFRSEREKKNTIQENEMLNVLFIIDDGERNALTTDVLVYYPVSNKGVVFNIPSNTGAIFRSLNRTDKINTVYKDKGISSYVKEVSSLTGLKIPYTIQITLDNLSTVADLLGGIEMLVPTPIDETGEDGERWLLPGGFVKLDGEKIHTYLEYELENDSESSRDDRRQKFFVALLKTIRNNKSLIEDKKNFPVLGKYFTTNVDMENFWKIMNYIDDIETDQLEPISVKGNTAMVGGEELLFPYEDDGQFRFKADVKRNVNSLITDGKYTRRYVLEVLNGTLMQGAASRAAALLSDSGYEILRTENAENKYEHTVIINHIGNEEAAKVLGDFLMCRYIKSGTLEGDAEDVSNVDFTLILGDDWDGRRYVLGGYTGVEDIAEEE